MLLTTHCVYSISYYIYTVMLSDSPSSTGAHPIQHSDKPYAMFILTRCVRLFFRPSARRAPCVKTIFPRKSTSAGIRAGPASAWHKSKNVHRTINSNRSNHNVSINSVWLRMCDLSSMLALSRQQQKGCTATTNSKCVYIAYSTYTTYIIEYVYTLDILIYSYTIYN